VILAVLGAGTARADLDEARRGEQVFHAAGCAACHTDKKGGGAPLAGGRALRTDFGTFYGPNITPHPVHGIGRWSEEDFLRALRHGLSPDGRSYFPAFPYTSFTRMADGDVRALWAYLRTVPPAERPNTPHDLKAPFGWRFLIRFWKWLYFDPGPFRPDPRAGVRINRGRYLVEALGHCGECHTPRNFLGGARRERHFAGGKGPEGKDLPNLTPTRLKKWSDAELDEFLVTGMTPDMDSANATMAEVVRNTTSRLTPADRAALIAYLRSLPPLP
jgi:mono/diheme cytochrome c family protein